MSLTNIISTPTCTILQGVNGIRLCEETWMKSPNHKIDVEEIKSKNNKQPPPPPYPRK